MGSLNLGEMLTVSKLGAAVSHQWINRVIMLIDAALGQIHDQEHPVHCTLLQAASVLKQQIDPQAAREVPYGRGCLLAWQARKVRDYIDGHIAGQIGVTDLCALIQCSEAHFSRAFRRTFGVSPHAFVIQRRLEFAVHYMLATNRCLSDIALGCGFTDQPHLCRHFRRVLGQTPAAWRRGAQDTTGAEFPKSDSRGASSPTTGR